MSEARFRRQFLSGLLAWGGTAAVATPQAASAGQSASPQTGTWNVVSHGAVGDGSHLNTAAIQSAIDECARAGGGRVYFPPGAYLTGTLILKSHVTLYFEGGSVLLGSKDLGDYPPHVQSFRSYTDNYTDKSLIYAEGIENCGLEGNGAIDGQGASFHGSYKVRPYLIRFISCRDIRVRDVRMLNSPMWVQHYLACEDVLISGISVRSRVNENNDGIDIDCCDRVRIANCDIWSGDDAIVLKSTGNRPCRDVTVTNCILSSDTNALKLGTETSSGFENIVINNCTVYDTKNAGVTLQLVDGGLLERVAVSNITMRNVGTPIFIRLGDRGRPYQEGGVRAGIGSLRNVVISNIEAVGASTGCAIAGLPSHPIRDVSLDNIRLCFRGEGAKHNSERVVPEEAGSYPEFDMFGRLPAYAFYCRHVEGLTLRNLQTSFENAEVRPALVGEDLRRMELASVCMSANDGSTVLRLNGVQDALIHGCRVIGTAASFIELAGKSTVKVSVIGNDLAKARRTVQRSPEVSADEVFEEANRVWRA
jgi:hypothetical protein